MALEKQALVEVLGGLSLPTGQTLAEAGVVSKVAVCDGILTATIPVSGLSDSQQSQLRRGAESLVRQVAHAAGEPLSQVTIQFGGPATAPKVVPLDQAARPNGAAPASPRGGSGGGGMQASAPLMPDVEHVIAVGAGKGGVGKSTVAVNLAVGLAQHGHAVGLLDGDIYGPSLPTMLGLGGMDANLVGNMLQPFFVHGVKAMTIGKLVDPEKPLIWRGPMAHGAFKQLAEQTQWGALDYLVIDLPPGTGDVSLTMAQLMKLTGAVVVCTPQKVAQDDAVRAIRMFQQLGIDVLGVVENMSYFIGDDGKEYDIFGRGGAQLMAQRIGVPFLGAVPINMALRKNSDSGDPSANWQGNTTLANELDQLVRAVEGQVALSSIRTGATRPTLTIS
ncbi:MAG: Mrp/NBP35 family ATP-binding protein [Phycisphaerales bacterium]